MNILYEDNHLLVVEKPVNVPVQEDNSHDADLLSLLKDYLKKKYDKPGNVYLGLVHRLDRPVGGVMVFARTSKAASRLARQIQSHQFHKEYLAVLTGDIQPESAVLLDQLKKDSRSNTVTVTKDGSGKNAELEYRTEKKTDGLSLVRVFLKTGRSHQIRVQFSSRGFPLWGDARYNPKAVPGQQIALWSSRLAFTHPVTGEELVFTSRPPRTQPWIRF